MKLYHEKTHVIKIEDFENHLLKNTIGGLVTESVSLTKQGFSKELIINYWKEVADFISTKNRLALDFDIKNNCIIAYEFDSVSEYNDVTIVYYDIAVGKYCLSI